jgi:hypothetical protein
LEEKFTGLLKGIAFSEETLVWVRQALRESHRDERQVPRRCHRQAPA